MAKKKTMKKTIPKVETPMVPEQEPEMVTQEPELNNSTDSVLATEHVEEVQTAPELPAEPDEVPDDQQEQQPKTKVPKINTKEEETPIVYTEEEIAPPDQDKTALDIEVEMSRQLSPEEAISFANTQPDPLAAIDALRKQRRLLDITATYQAAEDTGLRG